jgi:hypothetical protein
MVRQFSRRDFRKALPWTSSTSAATSARCSTLGIERLARAPGAARRLTVVESLMLDPRRRLVLIRADGREHLLLLGATSETVVESRAAGAGEAPP